MNLTSVRVFGLHCLGSKRELEQELDHMKSQTPAAPGPHTADDEGNPLSTEPAQAAEAAGERNRDADAQEIERLGQEVGSKNAEIRRLEGLLAKQKWKMSARLDALKKLADAATTEVARLNEAAAARSEGAPELPSGEATNPFEELSAQHMEDYVATAQQLDEASEEAQALRTQCEILTQEAARTREESRLVKKELDEALEQKDKAEAAMEEAERQVAPSLLCMVVPHSGDVHAWCGVVAEHESPSSFRSARRDPQPVFGASV